MISNFLLFYTLKQDGQRLTYFNISLLNLTRYSQPITILFRRDSSMGRAIVI